MNRADPIDRLVHELSRLPGIGRKSATRLAYFILRQPNGFADRLAGAVSEASREVAMCGV